LNALTWSEFQTIIRDVSKSAGPITEADSLASLDIDSLGVTRLIFEFEDRLQASFPDDMLSLEVFDSVGSLWNALGTLTGGAAR
jgi:acyl carrier protein